VVRNNGNYAPLPYRFSRYPKLTRNVLEANPKSPETSSSSRANAQIHGQVLSRAPNEHPVTDGATTKDGMILSTNERLHGPRKLFILHDPESSELKGHSLYSIEDWAQFRRQHKTNYLFIGYTANQFKKEADFNELYDTAERAARKAGVQAFWVANGCLDRGNDEDVSWHTPFPWRYTHHALGV
jgi:hypothetical protein